jgi:hypothetical protein
MTNVQKYLGVSKLTEEYDDNFFDDKNIETRGIKVEKILKSSSSRIIFLTSEKTPDGRIYTIHTLKRFRKKPRISVLIDPVFSTAEEAIKYFESK